MTNSTKWLLMKIHFSFGDGILMYREKSGDTRSVKKRISKDFQTRHPGKVRMKALMRSYVFCRNMDKEI